MRVLVVAATPEEVKPTLDHFQRNDMGRHYISFHSTGIGLAGSAVEITRLVLQNVPDLVIQAGIAGSLEGEISVGDTVLVKGEIIGDLGVWENELWKTIFDLSLASENSFPFREGILANPYLPSFQFMDLPAVVALSVNQISTDKRMIDHWKNSSPRPAIESMEGAALHEACLRLKIPFLQIRSVSNIVGERNKDKWNVPLAIDQLNQHLIRLLNNLVQETIQFSVHQP
jgi:futalosine hydrolase